MQHSSYYNIVLQMLAYIISAHPAKHPGMFPSFHPSPDPSPGPTCDIYIQSTLSSHCVTTDTVSSADVRSLIILGPPSLSATLYYWV